MERGHGSLWSHHTLHTSLAFPRDRCHTDRSESNTCAFMWAGVYLHESMHSWVCGAKVTENQEGGTQIKVAEKQSQYVDFPCHPIVLIVFFTYKKRAYHRSLCLWCRRAWMETVSPGSLLTCAPVLGFTPGYAIFPQLAPIGFFLSPFDLRRINSAWLPLRHRKTWWWVRQGHVERGTQWG